MGKRFRISTHENGYYCVSIPKYEGGEVVPAEEYDRVRQMLINVLDATYGTDFSAVGNGDGLPPEQANEIIEFWRSHLHQMVAEWTAAKKARGETIGRAP